MKFSLIPTSLNGKYRRHLRLRRQNFKVAEDWKVSLLAGFRAQAAKIEQPTSGRLMIWMQIAVLIIGLVLIGQLVRLQIVHGERYSQLSEGNRLREKITYTPRGRILDRNGRQLAANRPSFQLVAYPYLLPRSEAERRRVYGSLAKLVNVPAAEIKKLAEERGVDSTQPVLIDDNIAYEPALIVEQRLPEFEGFVLDAVPIREYVGNSGLGHILGYVGRASEQDIKNKPQLSLVDFVGKDGVEAQYDELLRGRNGVVETEVDATGRPLRIISEEPTQAGKDITLSIDAGLQRSLADAIKRQMDISGAKRAAGVAIDAASGEVLASVSLPYYDNNLFSGGISSQDYSQLINNPLQPLHNKVIGGGYPSGSIIKPMHLSAALQENVVDEHTVIWDRGQITVPSVYDPSVTYVFRGWNPAGLGPMDARRAVAMSSDIYFYTVGGGYQGFQGLGVDRLTRYYSKFGLGQLTGIDLPGEVKGRIPTPEWKKQVKGEDWFVGDTYNISIGQGDILVNPLQMAVATAAVANGGKLLTPHVFKQTADGEVIQQADVRAQVPVDQKNLQIAREGMRQVLGGTTPASTFAGVPVPVAGKSGTAETDPEGNRPAHAWYVAFAPYDEPKIVFSVLIEEAEGGSQFAAPAIAEAMEYYFQSNR